MRVTDVSQVKPGDEVTVTYRAKVSSIQPSSGGCHLYVKAEGRDVLRLLYLGDTDTVELTEPEYVSGGVYIDAWNHVYEYDDITMSRPVWYRPGDSSTYNYDAPVRPLTRMLPEGSRDD